MEETNTLTLEKLLQAKRLLDVAPEHPELILICPMCKTYITVLHGNCPGCGVKFHE